MTQAILDEIDKRSELMANIEYLCDMIGPRLTGSPEPDEGKPVDARQVSAVRSGERTPGIVDDRSRVDPR